MSESAVCVVQARAGSTRLPGKVLMDLAGRPLLAFLLDRLSGLKVDEVVVATSTLARDDPVADVARHAGVACVRGPETDVLARFAVALDAHPADAIVRLTADCPLTDPALVEAVLDLHRRRGADYTCNVLPRTFPKGLDVEVADTGALRRAVEEATDRPEREHVMPYLYRHPELFTLANLRSGEDLADERWTVDTAEDLAKVRRIVAGLDPSTRPGWREILAVAGRRPVLPAGGLRLRPADSGDAHRLLLWRNDADSVRFSESGRAVTPDEHRRWFDARLADPSSRIWVAECDAVPVGSVRVDVEAAVGTVSIAVAPEARGVGLGGRILRLLQQELDDDFQVVTLSARVSGDNAASLRLFERAGFRAVEERGPFRRFSWARMAPDRRESER